MCKYNPYNAICAQYGMLKICPGLHYTTINRTKIAAQE